MPDALTLWHALCSGTGRHLLGPLGFQQRQAVCPKSCVSGRKLRSSNCSPESQKKENISLPGWYRLSLYVCPDAVFQTYSETQKPDVYFFAARQNRTPALPGSCFLSWSVFENIVLTDSSGMFSRQVPQPGIQVYILPHPDGQVICFFFCDSGEKPEVLSILPGVRESYHFP